MSFEIPKGFVKSKSNDNEIFNAESLSDNKELWLLRVPDQFDLNKLAGRTFSIEQLQGPIPSIVDDLNGHRIIERSVKSETDTKLELDQNLGEEAEQLACLLPISENSEEFQIVDQPFDRIFHLVKSVDIPNTDKLAQDLLKEPFVAPQQPPQIDSETLGNGTLTNGESNGTPSKKARKETTEPKSKASKSKKTKKSK